MKVQCKNQFLNFHVVGFPCSKHYAHLFKHALISKNAYVSSLIWDLCLVGMDGNKNHNNYDITMAVS